MTAHSSFRVYPGGQLAGEIRVPGDKSISHRALMLGAIAQGVSEVSGFLDGEDCLATLAAMQAMGVQIEKPAATKVVIHGVGLHGLKAPTKPLYLGNSGTSIRLLAGLLSGQSFDVELSGDTSLSKRPMGRVIDPLQKMGAVIDSQPHQTAPLMIRAGAQLHGIRYVMPIASAQVKSCLLLAGLYAQGQTCVEEPAPTRDHTERMLQAMGCEVQRSGAQVCVAGSNTLSAVSFEVPADISSAAFFLVGASIAPGSDILLQHVGMNPTRTGVIDILRKMGADIVVCNERQISGEPVADLRVRAAPLTGIDIPEALVPLAIDEFPAIFIAAACAQGQTRLTGARELGVK